MATLTTDFFAHKGYRILAADLLILSIHDANQQRMNKECEEAIAWFNFKLDPSNPPKGASLRFQDCLDLLGLSSRTDEIRQMALLGDGRLLQQLKTMKAVMRDTRDDPLEVMPEKRVRVSGVLDVFKNGSMNVGPRLSVYADGVRGTA